MLTAHAIADRYLVPRQYLADHDPDAQRRFDDVAVQRIAQWYALRSSRPAWPDSLVARVGTAKEQIEAIISGLGDDLEVRVALSPRDEELPLGRTYKVAVWFVVDATGWEADADVRNAAVMAYGNFTAALGSCDDVVVDTDHGDVVPGDAFTWQQMAMTDEWNFANLSHIE